MSVFIAGFACYSFVKYFEISVCDASSYLSQGYLLLNVDVFSSLEAGKGIVMNKDDKLPLGQFKTFFFAPRNYLRRKTYNS